MKIHILEKTKNRLGPWGEAGYEVISSRFFWAYLTLVFVFGAAVYALAEKYGAGFSFSGVLYAKPLHGALFIFSALFVSLRLLYITIAIRPPRPLTLFIAELRTLWFTPRRIVLGMSLMIFIPIFFSFFTSAKNLIPFIQPFAWDPVLAEWDRVLHFGRQPWEWLHPVLKVAFITSAISFSYKLWFFNKYVMIFWQAFSMKRPNLRAQFFITMVLAWIINGFVIALMFSSAGPCYFDHFYPDLTNPYAELMGFLRQSHEKMQVMDLWAMDYLLQAYQAKTSNLFSGISAFPSMHVCVALLNALVGWRISHALGVVFTVYLVLIMAGSVHLGWHYAVDGYASLASTAIIWLIVGRFFPKDKEQETA